MAIFGLTAATLAQIAAVASVGAGVAGVVSANSAAKQAQAQGEAKSAQEELLATQREVDRKRELAGALAAQNASAGSRGISAFEGSPLTILQADVEAERQATERDRTQTQLAKTTATSQAKTQADAAKQRARIGLLTSIGTSAAGLNVGV